MINNRSVLLMFFTLTCTRTYSLIHAITIFPLPQEYDFYEKIQNNKQKGNVEIQFFTSQRVCKSHVKPLNLYRIMNITLQFNARKQPLQFLSQKASVTLAKICYNLNTSMENFEFGIRLKMFINLRSHFEDHLKLIASIF